MDLSGENVTLIGLAITGLFAFGGAIAYLFRSVMGANKELTKELSEQRDSCKKCQQKTVEKNAESQKCCLQKVDGFYNTMREDIKGYVDSQMAVDIEVNKNLVEIGGFLKDVSHNHSMTLEFLKANESRPSLWNLLGK